MSLNSRVTSIDYSSAPIIVTTSTGDVYSCDYAMCTFSVGVLKSNSVNFIPSLSPEKKAALGTNGESSVDYLFVLLHLVRC
jgi:polyamine oxidase